MTATGPRSQIPRKIYSLWLQGRSSAPPLVRFNFDRWAQLNPGYELHILNESDVEELLAEDQLKLGGITSQALSDVVRAKLLKEKGGVWVDASVMPCVPLDTWLPEATDASGFFAFERYDVPLSSWFLAASPENLVVSYWWKEVTRVWSSQRKTRLEAVLPVNPAHAVSAEVLAQANDLPYFWFHSLFQLLLENNAAVHDIWEKRYRLSAEHPHDLQNLFAISPNPTDDEILRATFTAYLQKLDWRRDYPLDRFERLLAAGRTVKMEIALPAKEEREKLLAELEMYKRQAADYADRLASTHRSLSWRITKPLRAVKGIKKI